MTADKAVGPDVAMDRIYRYQRHIYDATRKSFLFGRDHLVAELQPPVHGSVLEVGCGTGRNLIKAADRYPSVRLFGFDVSRAMLETAERSLSRTALKGRITLAQGDATTFDSQGLFGQTVFDRVFISFALSMIPDWQAVLLQSARCLAPGGALHIVDFGQQEHLPTAFRAVLFAWLRQFSVTPLPELEATLRAFAKEQRLELSYTRLYRGYAHSAVLRRV